jgi:hypothetical protein
MLNVAPGIALERDDDARDGARLGAKMSGPKVMAAIRVVARN